MKKGLLKNEDAVSPVIGAILILAIGVTILTNVQLNFVPAWNTQEDLDHLSKMNDDFKELKSGIESAIQSGVTLSLPMNMGFKYSPKTLVHNTKESVFASLDIQENTWAQIRYNEIFQDGMTDETSIKNLTTSTIAYDLRGIQKYNPFIYEHGLIRRNGSSYTSTSQTALTNGTIYLLSVKTPGPETITGIDKRIVTIYPTSVQRNSVLGKNVWLTLHTKPEYVGWWKESIEKEGGVVKKVDSINGIIIIYLDTIVIKMGEAYISTAAKTAPLHAPPYRIIKITLDNTYLPVDGTINLVVEVQDKYNNPVPNVNVNFNINRSRKPANSNGTATLLQSQATSGADGRASVTLKTGGAGFYYIDASTSGITTTFAYPASSQANVLKLDKAQSGQDYLIIANLTDVFGIMLNGKWVTFDTSDGNVFPLQDPTDALGNVTSTLNVASAIGIKLTNINISNTTTTSTIITWDTINNIIVSAKSGYVFNSIEVPTKINSTGCVQYGTVSSGPYPDISCDSTSASHKVLLSDLRTNTAYYFKVNSSNATRSATSAEYMFVTDDVPSDGKAPESITDLVGISDNPLFINWTWTNPINIDFDHVEVYINGIFMKNVTNPDNSFSAFFLVPNTRYNISTRTVDANGRVNASWVNDSYPTIQANSYITEFNTTTGSVLNPDDANNEDLLSANLSEEQVGGIILSHRPMSPTKTISNGIQGAVGEVDNPGLIDETLLLRAYTIKHAIADPGMTIGTITGGGDYSRTRYSDGQYLNLRESNNNTLDTRWNNWESFTNSSNSSLVGMNIGIEAYMTTGTSEAVYIQLWDFANNNWNTSWYQLGTSGLPLSDSNAVFWYNITNTAQIQRFVNSTGDYKIRLADAKVATGTTDTSRSTFYIDEIQVNFAYVLNALNATYTFNEPNASSSWQSIAIQDSSYADDHADVSIFNNASGQWESIRTTNFTGGTTLLQHVNTVIGTGSNASDYDSGSGQIKIKYNWTNSTVNNSLGVDILNVTVRYNFGGVYRLNITSNTTDIPNASMHALHIGYNVSGGSFNVSVWNGSNWNNKTTLNSILYTNITPVPLTLYELRPDGVFTSPGNVSALDRFFVLVRYMEVNANSTRNTLYLDYQRVFSS